jgi:predicted dehydrogenase
MTNIAIVGCGFVADYYLKTLSNYPHLKLSGVMDRVSDRADFFAKKYEVPAYRSLDELLESPDVDIVLNLTNPGSHYEVSHQCLEAGKHVYSEKPLAMEMSQATHLVEMAESKGLIVTSAPCSLLSETAQTIWKTLREEKLGKVRLVYAEMDDGLVHRMPYKKWVSESGIPWPYKDEFEVGCTLEHAGYYITWLVAFFGPIKQVTAFSSTLVDDKDTDIPLDENAPDFSVACLTFESGVVARLTCSIVAPHDHTLRIIGDEGILYTEDCWYYRSPVYIRRWINLRRKTFLNPWKQKVKLLTPPGQWQYGSRGSQRMDFCRGVAEMAESLDQDRPCRLSPRYSLHVNEVVLAIQNALDTGDRQTITTRFDPIAPMDWATSPVDAIDLSFPTSPPLEEPIEEASYQKRRKPLML